MSIESYAEKRNRLIGWCWHGCAQDQMRKITHLTPSKPLPEYPLTDDFDDETVDMSDELQTLDEI